MQQTEAEGRAFDRVGISVFTSSATGASTKELMHRLGHASPRAALRYQHATAERDEAIADGIDRLLEAAKTAPETTVAPFRRVPRRGTP